MPACLHQEKLPQLISDEDNDIMACHAARMVRQKQKAESSGIETDISPEQRKCLETAFEAADKNGDGILSVDEYYDIFQAHGLTIGMYTSTKYTYYVYIVDVKVRNMKRDLNTGGTWA